MSAARKIIDRAREAGLSAELTEQLERHLIPRVERLLKVTPNELGTLLLEVIEAMIRDREVAPALPKRVPGGWKGRVRISEDFDAPLADEVEREFYDSVLEPRR